MVLFSDYLAVKSLRVPSFETKKVLKQHSFIHCVCMHMCVHIIACQKTTLRSWSSPFIMWAMETELRLLALAANVLTHLAGSWRVLQDKLSSKTSHFPPSTPCCYLVSLCSAWVLLEILQKALLPTLTSSGITSLVWVSIGQEIKHV